ncbi:hypothetical protein D3C76_1392140 [compost metagenome]
MEENNAFSKSSLLKFRISRSILIILEFILILGCFYFGGVQLNILIYIAAAFFGFVIGMFRKPVRRTLELFVTIPASIYFGTNIFMSSKEDISIKIIFLILIVLTIIGSEIIESKLLDKLRKDNIN